MAAAWKMLKICMRQISTHTFDPSSHQNDGVSTFALCSYEPPAMFIGFTNGELGE